MNNQNAFMPNNAFIPGGPAMPGPAPMQPAAPTQMQNTPMPGMPMPGAAAPRVADNFEVDLTDVQDNFTIEDGLYRCRCIEVAQDVSKGGNPMFVWTFAVVGTKYDGREFKVFTALTPAAMWKVAETVTALGVGQTGQVVKFKRSEVIGKECGASIAKTEYNGTTRSQIERVISLQELQEAMNAR